MRQTTGLFFILLIFVTACQPKVTATPSPLPPQTRPGTFQPEAASPGSAPAGNGLQDTSSLPEANTYTLTYEISDDLTQVNGDEILDYTNYENTDIATLVFHLYPNLLGGKMEIGQVLVDEAERPFTLTTLNSLLSVQLETPLKPGQSATVNLAFHLEVPESLESNYGVLTSTEGVLTLAHAYPTLAVYAENGWDMEPPAPQGDLTFTDASYYQVRVSAPQGVVLVASGVETGSEQDGDRQVTSFTAGPARDFFLSASRLYQVQSQTAGGVTVNAYTPAGLEEGGKLAIETAIEALRIFSARYGAYPYTEFDIVATPTYALGIEYPGMTAINQKLLELDATLNDTPTRIYLESTVAHEAGHQWFYNLVGSDQVSEPWLDESLTQFITWQYFEDRYGQGGALGFEQSLRSRWKRVENKPTPLGLPVSAYDEREYSAIIYGRGAFFFQALEEEMGQAKFEALLRDYAEVYRWKLADTQGFKTLAEEHCGCDLTPLFEAWVYPAP